MSGERKFVKGGKAWPSQGQSKKRKYAYVQKPMFSGMGLAIEKKFLDLSVASDAIVNSTAGAEVDPSSENCLNALAIGDTESTRDGRQVKSLSLHVRGFVLRTTAVAASLPPAGRSATVYLVWDKQTNGAQFNSEDVMINTQANAATMSKSFRNLRFQKRFQILGVKTVDFTRTNFTNTDGVGDYDTGGDLESFEFNVKLGHTVNFDGTTATIGVMVDNSYHLMAIASGNGLTIHYNSRYRFAG